MGKRAKTAVRLSRNATSIVLIILLVLNLCIFGRVFIGT